MIDPLQVKAKSEEAITSLGCEAPATLPQVGLDEIALRAPEQVAERALVLNLLVNLSFGAPPNVALSWLERHGLVHAASPKELAALTNHMPLDESLRNRLRWNIEPLWAAAWVGSLVADLAPVQPVGESLASLFPSLQEAEAPDAFFGRFRVRPLEDIYPKLDLFYRSHWYARNCTLTGKNPFPFNPGIVQSRRQLLEWVTHADAEWEDVDLST